jgi:hypothetical protein
LERHGQQQDHGQQADDRMTWKVMEADVRQGSDRSLLVKAKSPESDHFQTSESGPGGASKKARDLGIAPDRFGAATRFGSGPGRGPLQGSPSPTGAA